MRLNALTLAAAVPVCTTAPGNPGGAHNYTSAKYGAATPWDPELATAMRHLNLRIGEELTLDALLQDLSP